MSDVEVAAVPKAPKVSKKASADADAGAPPAPEDVAAMFDLSLKKKKKTKKVKKEVRLCGHATMHAIRSMILYLSDCSPWRDDDAEEGGRRRGRSGRWCEQQ